MIRALAFLTALWPAAAWAQTAETISVLKGAADKLMDAGTLGVMFVLYAIATGIVIAALWKRSRDLEGNLKECQDKRLVDTALFIKEVAKSSGDATAAIESSDKTLAGLAQVIDACFDLMKTIPPLVTSVKDETQLSRGRVEALSDIIRDRLPGGHR